MAKGLRYQPKKGSILICDFSGNKVPEFNKKRPVLVLFKDRYNPKLVTVLPISSKKSFGNQAEFQVECPTPTDLDSAKSSYIKCNYITVVSIERLSLIKTYNAKGKINVMNRLDEARFQEAKEKVASWFKSYNIVYEPIRGF